MSRARTLLASASVAMAACTPPPQTPSGPTPSASSSGAAAAPKADDDVRDPKRGPRALVFRAPGFPSIDAPPIDDATLDEAWKGLAVDRAASAAELSSRLKRRDVDVLVLPYGSAFPVEAWPRILGFLGRGGSVAVLGGAPFHEPVRSENGRWITGPRTTTFAHALAIGPAEPIARGNAWTERAASADTGWSAMFAGASQTTWALTLRLTSSKDFPDEHGTTGPRDAVARPLLHVVDQGGIPRGCSLLEIDRQLGDMAGGRWLFATTDAKLGAPAVHAIVARALEGGSELRAVPVRASISPGEAPKITISESRATPTRAHVAVTDDAGHEVSATDVDLTGAGTVTIGAKLAVGLHHVTVTIPGASWSPRVARTGFWVKDDKLLATGPKITASRDWLRKDGAVFPVVGTTYMASDVHRKFLFEPNPHLWDADFAEMKKRGIGFVRTGLWTAWSRVLLPNGTVDEGVLSALEAYVQSAARHGIVVCFDFFAFLPLSFGGDNPYLDPRALEGQKAMLTAFASRFRASPWIHWDLINEPSYAARKDLWSTRPIGDDHEKQAWRAWVKSRHGDDPAKLRQLWREPAWEPLDLPKPDDFEQKFVQNARRPRKARDFQEFKEEVVAGWAKTMRDALHAASPDTLVTLGQDEGGIYERPTQQFLAASLDYTAVHTWWKNDDLLWDGVLTKVPEKASLHQETGLMRLETPDGAPWRTPDAAARLFERKLGYAFAGRGCGVVEWAWNINPYMPIDEESTIGIFRPDGTAKPELEPMSDLGAFFAKAAPLLDDFDPDPVLLVIPHARGFLGRPNGIDPTRIVVRVLGERFGVVPTAISDLRLTAERLKGRKLVIVPSPDVLDEAPAKLLLDASRAGTRILVTGAIEGDSYGMETPSLKALGLLGPSRPVAMHEATPWSSSGSVLFEGQQELTRRGDTPSLASLTGNVWHEPLPLELAREREPLVKLLGAALGAAQVPTMPGDWGLVARVLVAPRAALIVVVNERPANAVRKVTVFGKTLEVPVRALGSRLAIVDRASGAVIASTSGDPVR